MESHDAPQACALYSALDKVLRRSYQREEPVYCHVYIYKMTIQYWQYLSTDLWNGYAAIPKTVLYLGGTPQGLSTLATVEKMMGYRCRVYIVVWCRDKEQGLTGRALRHFGMDMGAWTWMVEIEAEMRMVMGRSRNGKASHQQ